MRLRRYLRGGWARYHKLKRQFLQCVDIIVVHTGSVPNPVGAHLKEPTRFDNVEFGIATEDAMSVTASTRRLIELTFSILELTLAA
jgi:hypothetical protein